MANIHIKELFGSDNITDLTEKVNFNFDQLILAGGGPEGPIGGTGLDGVSGPDGKRGSQWVAGFGATTINLPTDGVYRDNDFLLDDGGSFVSGGATGQVFYYKDTTSTWVDTGINLRGPKGDVGGDGDGSISILPGLTQTYGTQSAFVPTEAKLGDFITGLDTSLDEDDYKKGASQAYINAGVDYSVIGRGNNSLVLGRYATLFPTGLAGSKFTPPGAAGSTNGYPTNFPQLEANVPMLYVSQNDYQDPTIIDNTYKNGISIGLTKSHPNSQYGSDDPFRIGMDYNNNANISIENKFHDLRISSTKLLTLSATNNSTFFRLGNIIARTVTGQTLDERSTKLFSGQYTNFKINNSFFVDLSDASSSTNNNELIHNAQSTFFQNDKFYDSDVSGSTDNDTRQEISKTFIGTKNNSSGKIGANELVFFNGDSLTTDADGKTITRSIDPTITTTGSSNTTFQERSMFDSNSRYFEFRIGQTTVKTGRMDGVNANGTPKIDPLYPNNTINITYQGQGYDTPFIQYSGIDLFNTYTDSINGGAFRGYAPYAVIPNDSALEEALGYDIKDPIGFTNAQDYSGSRSMSRMGIYPGFFRKEKNGTTYTSGTAEERQAKFFDVAHRMMPTGSLDVFGTVRIREQETTDNGAKDGWIAVNKKDGILGFQDPNAVGGTIGTPTFSIIMFPEMASNKFSFYVASKKTLGSAIATAEKAYDFKPGTTAGNFSAFPGKGSEELKDYYMCNGAVLADVRDILVTGPFSKMKGMNVDADDGNENVQNGINTGTGISNTPDFLYEVNNEYISPDGSYTNASPALVFENMSVGQYYANVMNGSTVIENLSVNRKNGFNNVTKTAWGYSVLAGSKIESGFRVVLPNYFGRVAKMQFPNSESIIRAIGGDKITKEFSTDTRDSGYTYYKTGNKITYNKSWMMKSMFDPGGFPYINGLQMPRNVTKTAAHVHNKGTYSILSPEMIPSLPVSASLSTSYGAHAHVWVGDEKPFKGVQHDVRGANAQSEDDTADNSTDAEIAVSGAHGHQNDAFAGESGSAGSEVLFSTERSWIDGQGRDYAKAANNQSGQAVENYAKNYDINGFEIKRYFAYVIGGTNSSLNIYSNFSNWVNYEVDTTQTNPSNSAPDQSGQKFISPPFKGTIMAINLKGLRNPNRLGDDGNPSVITDLHFVGGVPQCGIVFSATPPGTDMSWYSELTRTNESNYTSPGINFTNTTDYLNTALFNSSLGYKYDNTADANATSGSIVRVAGIPMLYAYEYGFKQMARNDDTMHPETFVATEGWGYQLTSTLDYKAETDITKRRVWDLYRTNLTRRNDFNA